MSSTSTPIRAGSSTHVVPASAARELQSSTRAMFFLLLLQFLLGMIVNLYVTVPSTHPGSSASNYFGGLVQGVPWAIAHGALALQLHAALGLARRLGARQTEAVFADSLMNVLITLGRFDEAEELGTDVLASSDFPYPGTFYLHLLLGYLDALRGRLESARQHFGHVERPAETAELQSRVFYGFAASVLAFAEGDFRTALDEARQALAAPGSNQGLEGLAALRECLPVAIDAALALQAIEEAEKLVDVVAARPPGATPLFLRAQLHRACALVSAARGDTGDVEAGLEAAEKGFRDLNYPYWTARVQLDLAEWLARQGRLDESARIATEAAAAFETLGAAPMLAHARALLEPEMVRNPGADAERAVAQGRPSLSE